MVLIRYFAPLILAVVFRTSEAFLFDTAVNVGGLFLDTLQGNLNINAKGVFSDANLAEDIAEDTRLLTPQLITKYGYPSETHTITTEDGYILELHRIPKSGAPAVLLMHGLLDTSATWILMGPNSGLGYILSNAGYDVWMGNVRGNRYSQQHDTLSSEDRRFWDFSFHEMGTYDLPAMIDYILEKTGQGSIHYIGHSQGTAMFWVMCSEEPQYSKKITSMHALAPIAFLGDMANILLKTLTLGMDVVDVASSLLNVNQILPNTELMVKSAQKACNDAAVTQEVCSNMLFLVAGYNSEQLNRTMLPVILSHTPSGASKKQFLHFGQLIRSGRFKRFSYGINQFLWFLTDEYDLSNVDVPVALYYAENDLLVSTNGVDELAARLPNVIDKYLVSDPNFNHLDFVWAVDAKELVFDRIIENMRNVHQTYS